MSKCLCQGERYHAAIETSSNGPKAARAAELIGELKEFLPVAGCELLGEIEEAIVDSQGHYWQQVIKSMCDCPNMHLACNAHRM